MQNLVNCPNRHFVVSTKLLNSVLQYGARRYTIFNARPTNTTITGQANRLLSPLPMKWYKEIRKELSTLRSFLIQNRLVRPCNFSRLFTRRNLSTSNKNSARKSPNGKRKPGKDEREAMLLLSKLSVISISIVLIIYYLSRRGEEYNQLQNTLSWQEFEHQLLTKGEVREIYVNLPVPSALVRIYPGAIINGTEAKQEYYILDIPTMELEQKVRQIEARLGIKPGEGVPIIYSRVFEYLSQAAYVIFILLISFFVYSVATKGVNIKFDIRSHFGHAKYTLIEPFTGKGVRFEDVAGLKEAKTEVMEFVDYLKNPERYRSLGAKVPKGALLLGPPGCGKTLLAKAVATEANVHFFSMNGSEFIELLGGLGAARVRNLFKDAKKRAPSIIYIDEIDAIGKKRSEQAVEFSNSESDRTLNQLLVEMDGMTTHGDVIILASTNRAEVLDKALLRPGRFDRHILIDLPTLEERKQIFESHLKSLSLDSPPTKYSGYMAYLTPGFSGADIANVCNEAALHAARDKKKVVDGKDLLYAIDRTIGGTAKKTSSLTPIVKKVVAYHEAGHAIVGWLLEHTDALLKVTIVPRTNMQLGFAQHIQSDQKLQSKEELFQRMCMMLGGRVAEYLTFGQISTNAENDLKKVTKIAYHQVQQFGMSPNVGLISFNEEATTTRTRKMYSKRLANLMDVEVRKIIGEAYNVAEKLLKENSDKLTKIAEALLEKETLTYEDIEKLIGPPPYGKKRLVEPVEFEKVFNQTESRSPEPSAA